MAAALTIVSGVPLSDSTTVVEALGTVFQLDGQSQIAHQRFIRIEYKHGDDERYKDWKLDQRFEVEGKVAWDTDRQGFTELHPEAKSQVTFLDKVCRQSHDLVAVSSLA